MRSNFDALPTVQSMKAPHKTRRFRRGNAEHGNGRSYLATKHKPWKSHTSQKAA